LRTTSWGERKIIEHALRVTFGGRLLASLNLVAILNPLIAAICTARPFTNPRAVSQHEVPKVCELGHRSEVQNGHTDVIIIFLIWCGWIFERTSLNVRVFERTHGSYTSSAETTYRLLRGPTYSRLPLAMRRNDSYLTVGCD